MPGTDVSGLVMLSQPSSPLAEAFRVLRANLEQAVGPDPLRSILLTSPTQKEDRHRVAANLAMAFAESGTETALVDADMHEPQLHTLLSLEESPGLFQCLSDSIACSQAIQAGPLPMLSVVTAGGTPPVPARLLGAKKLEPVLAELLEQAQIAIVVGPPVLPVADVNFLAPCLESVLVLSTAYKTARSDLREAKLRLDNTAARILGVVLDGVSGRLGG